MSNSTAQEYWTTTPDANDEPPKPPVWLSLVEDGAEMQLRDIPEIVEIVDSIVAEYSKLSICSSAKCFKTWLTIYMALTISHGVDFLGHCTDRRRVLRQS